MDSAIKRYFKENDIEILYSLLDNETVSRDELWMFVCKCFPDLNYLERNLVLFIGKNLKRPHVKKF